MTPMMAPGTSCREDVETATALTGMPDAPVPLAAAILLCMASDGYLTAATQSALLESYAGAMAAAAARSLADDARLSTRTSQLRPPGVAAAVPAVTQHRVRTRIRRIAAFPRALLMSLAPCRPQSAGIPATAWAALDAVDLVAEPQYPVPTLQDVPPFMRAAVRGALVTALSRLRRDYATTTAGDYAATSRAWKLFLLSPRMLLARPTHQGADGRLELLERAAAFDRGDGPPHRGSGAARDGNMGPRVREGAHGRADSGPPSANGVRAGAWMRLATRPPSGPSRTLSVDHRSRAQPFQQKRPSTHAHGKSD